MVHCIVSCAVVTISFNPQNYTIPEGSVVVPMIVLDRASPRNITVTVTTMDITAQCEQHMKRNQLRNIHYCYSYLDVLASVFGTMLQSMSTTCPEFSAPDDYGGGTFTCTILAGVTIINCPTIPTYLNLPSETDEYFKATLSLPGGLPNTQVGPDPAFVTITDRTGKNEVIMSIQVVLSYKL